jgi:hypothetical protein
LFDNNEQCLEPVLETVSDAASNLEPGLRADFRQSRLHPGRLVEVGFIPNFEPREFAIHFEGFPLWLLSIERNFCTKLHVLGWASAGGLRRHLEEIKAPVSLAHRAFTHLGLGRIRYHAELTPPPGGFGFGVWIKYFSYSGPAFVFGQPDSILEFGALERQDSGHWTS